MVKVEVNLTTIRATGHAMSPKNDKDNDLVCCAVSTLMQALKVGINKRFLETVKDEPGHLEYKIYQPTELGVQLVVMANIKMIVNSLQQLADENPKYLKVVTD